jgi:hypothetical protein
VYGGCLCNRCGMRQPACTEVIAVAPDSLGCRDLRNGCQIWTHLHKTSLESPFWVANETIGGKHLAARRGRERGTRCKKCSVPISFFDSRCECARPSARAPPKSRATSGLPACHGDCESTRLPIHAKNDGPTYVQAGDPDGPIGDRTWAAVARVSAGTPSSPLDLRGGWETRQGQRWNDRHGSREARRHLHSSLFRGSRDLRVGHFAGTALAIEATLGNSAPSRCFF